MENPRLSTFILRNMGLPNPATTSFKQLWAPWRDRFIYHPKAKGCIFCQKPRSRNDIKNLIVWRGKTVYTMLNLYPYNNGHLMIAPYRHLKSTTLLSKQEMVELFEMANKAVLQLEKKLKPHGFNMGFNVGRAAGAGYDKHIHLHVVPRWNGDTNFMPVLSGNKVISESLKNLRSRLLS